jgi:hypothetical protein
MKPLLIRCSSLGKIMTEAKSKKPEDLSVGAKTHVREIAAQDILGIEFEIGGKELEKGIVCEPDSLGLLNRVLGLSLVKNTERRDDGLITGEADLFNAPARGGYDLKTAWSAATFPIIADDIGGSQRGLYEWQCRGYMKLWDADRWGVAYALVNTPEDLIRHEPASLHFFDHIPEHMRLTVWTIERDRQLEELMAIKVRAARAYYAQVVAEFHATHHAIGQEPPPWVEAAPTIVTATTQAPQATAARASLAEPAF